MVMRLGKPVVWLLRYIRYLIGVLAHQLNFFSQKLYSPSVLSLVRPNDGEKVVLL